MAVVAVTEAAVRKIIPDIDSALSDLTPFLLSSDSIVDDELEGKGLEDIRLTKIKEWLAAHFIAVADLRASQETVEGVSASYQYRLGLNLQNTMYGQQAMFLDTSGTLAGLNDKKRSVTPEIRVLKASGDKQ